MRQIGKRLLSLLLCICMVLSLLPGSALKARAAGTEGMITIEMTDSHGDSWSGNAIEIYADGVLLDTAAITESAVTGTWTGELSNHTAYAFKWVQGNYANETSFVIYIGTEMRVNTGGGYLPDGYEILSVDPVCTEPVYENGVCTSCGTACVHKMNTAGLCTACGYECPSHSFTGGICAACGGVCPHSAALAGECTLCSEPINLTIDMTAKFGYGWDNCGKITVFADGSQIGVAALDDETTGSWSVPFDSLTTYTFQWSKESWPDECAFTVKVGNTQRYAANNSACEALEDGVFLTIASVCSSHDSFNQQFMCTDCGLSCRHQEWTDGACDACGFVCGTDAEHDWDLGICKVCSKECGHASWTDFVCDTCGFACGSDAEHDLDENRTCTLCGFVCGTSAGHTWDKGVCKLCEFACPHERYEAGLCESCGYYESITPSGTGANGFALYEIGNASQLLWFADYVNSNEVLKTVTYNDLYGMSSYETYYTSGCVNAKLMADIDMTGLPWIPIGKAEGQYNGYTGVFDGNGHTVSGIDYSITADGNPIAGFFGDFSGTVKNLNVRGNFKAVGTEPYQAAYAGGIAACCLEARFATSYTDTDYVYPVIENCTFVGSVYAESITQAQAGGIAGFFADGTVTNCVSAAAVTAQAEVKFGGAFVGAPEGSTAANCYYDATLCGLDTCYEGALQGVTGLPTANFASGAVAYALGFGQTLGTDTYPACGGDPVYPVTTGCVTYANTQTDPTEKAHVGTPTCTEQALCQDCGERFGEALGHGAYDANGKCVVCGEYAIPKQNGTGANGFALYEIENASQLLWFAEYVNSGEVLRTVEYFGELGESYYTYYTTGCVNAKLMADIDMTGLPWIPIGKAENLYNGYTGVFDGNGHTVSGIDYSITADGNPKAGFFGDFSGTVKNLNVRGDFKAVGTEQYQTAYAGGIAACCVMAGFETSIESVDYVYPVIENCTFVGSVYAETITQAQAGGIAGLFAYGTMTNCVSAATVTAQAEVKYGGALIGVPDGSTVTNCYYDATLCSLGACHSGALQGVTGLPTADFADGAVAYALGFGQTLGTDAYPSYGDDAVYRVTNCMEQTGYSNTDADGEHADLDKNGRCDACNTLMAPAALIYRSISLKGNIAINYYMLLSEEVLADETAYIQFTLADGEVITVPVGEGVETERYGDTFYVFTCAVSAKEMSDSVTCQFFYNGGSTSEDVYDVKAYADYMLTTSTDEELKALVSAMLNYGAASQIHFEYNTNGNDLTLPDYSNVVIGGYNTVAGQGTDLAKFHSASLLLKSETTLRFFFAVDASVESFTVTHNGQPLTVKQRGGLYYVDVAGISAKDLDENVTIVIHDGTDTANVSYNPMSYCQSVRNDTTGAFDQELKDLVAALYLYNQAANTYLEEN